MSMEAVKGVYRRMRDFGAIKLPCPGIGKKATSVKQGISGRHELSESSIKVFVPRDSRDVEDVAVVTVWRQMLCQ